MTDQIEDLGVELDEDVNNVEEAHDPKNAEDQSVDSVDKATDAAKPAKKRKGDKANADSAPAETKESYDFSDDLNALVSEEATLSEGFKEKAGLIFEAAIQAKVADEVARLEESYAEQLDEEIKSTKEDLVEKVDNYLNYVVENWMEENKLAIQAGLRAEIAEGFMNSLKDLFVESYIEVPESKVDLVDDLAQEVQDLEEQLNDQTQKNIEMTESLNELQRKDIIREASKDLAETQVAKLEKLAEGVAFEGYEESYFKAEAVESVIAEETEEESGDSVEINEAMSQYLTAIRKSIK
jgi:hypothetical protein